MLSQNTSQNLPHKIYYHILQGSRYTFADERNKKKLLDTVLATQDQEKWCIYAFCITDDKAYFLMGVNEEQNFLLGLQKITEQFTQYSNANRNRFWQAEVPVLSFYIEELYSAEDLVVYCRKVHHVPLEKGYVEHLADYWWSSYITYIGIYAWEMVEEGTLLLHFSPDEELARRKFRQYHCGKVNIPCL